MKKIIDGRKYDTDTAREVASSCSEPDRGTFGWTRETLYRKRNGEFFMLGEGGPSSKYARQVEQCGWSEGWRIMPMTYDEARRWAEDALDADDYEAAFGQVDEDDSTVAVTVRVPASAKAALDREVSRSGRTASDVVAELLASLA